MNWIGLLLLFVGLWALAEPLLASMLHLPSHSFAPRARTAAGILFVALGIALMLVPPAAASVGTPPEIVQVPESAALYRRTIEVAAAEVWGIEASPARLAAQIHQESRFNPKARSSAGAEGLAQFMPGTARWIAEQFPDKLGQFDPWDGEQAVLAAAIYDEYLRLRNKGSTDCDTWAFGLSAYNGGERALRAEQRSAVEAQLSRERWFGDVESRRARSPAAWKQNRDYVRRILRVLEPAYVAAGWSGQAVCS
jgi:soluble lytic murein transglycosylase-like protein